MKRVWTVISLVVAVSIVLAWAASCRKDVYVEPPPSILGNYKGTYCYNEDDNNPLTTDLDTCQAVKVTFNLSGWIMYMDADVTPDSARMSCDCRGDYTLENGVQMIIGDDSKDSNLTNQVCTYGWLPGGSYQLLRNQSESCELLLQQSVADAVKNVTIHKTICLKMIR
jgi:hypothetical protein